MRTILLVAALAAVGCGGGDDGGDPHAVVRCEGGWDQKVLTACEAGCAAGQSAAVQDACTVGGTACPAGHVMDFDGQLGCCSVEVVTGDDGTPVETAVFAECE